MCVFGVYIFGLISQDVPLRQRIMTMLQTRRYPEHENIQEPPKQRDLRLNTGPQGQPHVAAHGLILAWGLAKAMCLINPNDSAGPWQQDAYSVIELTFPWWQTNKNL